MPLIIADEAQQRRAIEQDCARLVALYANLNDAAHWHDLTALYAPDGRMAGPRAPRGISAPTS